MNRSKRKTDHSSPHTQKEEVTMDHSKKKAGTGSNAIVPAATVVAQTRSELRAIADVTVAAMNAREQEAKVHIDALKKLLADGVQLTVAQRKAALRLGGDGEVEALYGVLDFVDKRPEIFTDLAELDSGVDPTKFETGVLRDRLENAATITGIAGDIADVLTLYSDSAAYLANLSKGPVLLAYDMAKPHHGRDLVNGKLLSKAIDLYRLRAARGAKTRAEAKSKASAAAPSPSQNTAAVSEPDPEK